MPNTTTEYLSLKEVALFYPIARQGFIQIPNKDKCLKNQKYLNFYRFTYIFLNSPFYLVAQFYDSDGNSFVFCSKFYNSSYMYLSYLIIKICVISQLKIIVSYLLFLLLRRKTIIRKSNTVTRVPQMTRIQTSRDSFGKESSFKFLCNVEGG